MNRLRMLGVEVRVNALCSVEHIVGWRVCHHAHRSENDEEIDEHSR